MKIAQEIEVPAPIERVWAFFDDVPRVASCMPGATLSKIVDEKTFDGNVAIKVGPVAVNYQGRLLIEERDDGAHIVHLKANGKDRKGAGTASAKIVATLTELAPNRTKLAVDSDVQLSGRIASLGRGVQDVAGKLFTEFGNRMSAEIASGEAAAHAAALATESVEPAPGLQPVSPLSGVAAAPAAPTRTAPPPLPPRSAEPIKVGALLWSILKDKFFRLFRRRSARR